MIVEIKIPEVGESITEGVLAVWLKADGDAIAVGEPLFELETDKVTMTVPAEHGGRLEVIVAEGEVVQVGQVVARIDTSAATDSADVTAPADEPADDAPAEPAPREAVSLPGEGPPIAPRSGIPQAEAKLSGHAPPALSPAVRRMVEEHGLDASAIPGSGKDGRLTKEDVQAHLGQRGAASAGSTLARPQPAAPAPAAAAPTALARPAALTPTPLAKADLSSAALAEAPRETRIRMSRLRKRIAERLVLAQQTAAMLTTFNECDMSAVMSFRSRHKDKFEKKFDVRLGFMSFFVKAAVDALKTVPQLNARIEGEEFVQQHYYDIGVAVGTEQGLVVPVIRDADRLSFANVEKTIGDFARRARDRKLTLNELTGGCFTISNGGIYGSLLSTPILNPPQSGILGMHRIQKRPMVTADDQIVVKPMMYLALSYDHRIVDGGQAVTFLKRIVECIEDPERMLLEV